MAEIVWKEPPPRTYRGKAGRWVAVAAELRAHPGEWALVATDVTPNLAQTLKRHGLETAVRGIRNKKAAEVYARWVGES